MKSKNKKLLMYVAVALGAMFLFKKQSIAQIGANLGINSSAAQAEFLAMPSEGESLFLEELNAWGMSTETSAARAEFMSMAIPGISKSDLVAYWDGMQAGEVEGFTAQDYQLIQDTFY